MADLEVSVNIRAEKKSAEDFAEQIAQGLKKSLGKLGLGNVVGTVTKGASAGAGGMSGLVSGLVGGLVASGIVGAVMFIADALKDFPMVTAIMKLLKLILLILFLPLIPVLKPTLQALAEFVKWFAPLMKQVAGWVQKFYDFLAMLSQGIGKFLGNLIFNVIQGAKAAWEFIKNAGTWLWENTIKPGFEFLKDVGTKIWDILKSPFDFLKNTIESAINAIIELINKIPGVNISPVGGSSGGGGGGGGGTTSAPMSMNLSGGMSYAPSAAAAKSTQTLAGKIASTVSSAVKSVGNAVKSLFGKQLGGVISSEGMYYLHKGERIMSATERGAGGGMNITFTINNPTIRKDADIKMLVREIEDHLKSGLRRRISYI